jgi:hypothetical protein
MSRTFEIRPLSLEDGFSISCNGVLQENARRLRLIDAIVHAVQLGRDFEGSIQIFDASGKLSEVLPLPRTPALAD